MTLVGAIWLFDVVEKDGLFRMVILGVVCCLDEDLGSKGFC